MEELAPIVIRARQGESGAFEVLVRRFQDMAVGYAFSLLGDWHEAEDAAQDAFVSAYCSILQLRERRPFQAGFGASSIRRRSGACASRRRYGSRWSR